jgi:protoheme ferro-lyase
MKMKVPPVEVKKEMRKEIKKRAMITLKERTIQRITIISMSPQKSRISSNTSRDTNLTKSNWIPHSNASSLSSFLPSERSMGSLRFLSLSRSALVPFSSLHLFSLR